MLAARSQSLAISGQCWCMRIWSTTLMTRGVGFLEVRFLFGCVFSSLLAYAANFRLQAFKHIFTSPSSVEKEVKAMRLGNTRIHGMTRVTAASIAYTATQVRLLLTRAFYRPNNNTDRILSRFASPYHHHRYFVDRILQRILNASIILYWNSWTIRRRRRKSTNC